MCRRARSGLDSHLHAVAGESLDDLWDEGDPALPCSAFLWDRDLHGRRIPLRRARKRTRWRPHLAAGGGV